MVLCFQGSDNTQIMLYTPPSILQLSMIKAIYEKFKYKLDKKNKKLLSLLK